MSCNNVQILNFNHNIVEIGSDNKLIITDNVKCNSITIPQPVTNILQINSPGPQGPQGPSGSGGGGGNIDTGSFATTGSNTFIGNQIISGSIILKTPISGSLTFTGSKISLKSPEGFDSVLLYSYNGYSGGDSAYGVIQVDKTGGQKVVIEPTGVGLFNGNLSANAKLQFNGATGSFTNLPDNGISDNTLTVAANINGITIPADSKGIIDLGGLATTGSNTFIDNQIVTGSVNITGSLTLNGVTGNLRPYKVYTALLSQGGGSSTQELIAGNTLLLGVTYYVFINEDNVDLTIFGAPNSNEGTYFVCTQVGNLPGNVNISLQYNTGAPVARILENTIGDIWFTYLNIGEYEINSNALFIGNKTTCITSQSAYEDTGVTFIYRDNVNLIYIETKDFFTQISANDILSGTMLEIRVYN
jgi:hypothetical protein